MREEMAWPNFYQVAGDRMRGRRSRREIMIPYTTLPQIEIGDSFYEETGGRTIEFKAIDLQCIEGGTLNIGTKHPHILKLEVRNVTAEKFEKPKSTGIVIGNVSGENFQIGNNNTMSITMESLIDEVSKSGDSDAKTKLAEVLSNPTVASILGGAAPVLLQKLFL